MSDRSPSAPTDTGIAADEKLVDKLRARAREAAAASVHHATLSEQYLELSQKFDALAERSGSTDSTHLLQSIAALEQQVPATASRSQDASSGRLSDGLLAAGCAAAADSMTPLADLQTPVIPTSPPDAVASSAADVGQQSDPFSSKEPSIDSTPSASGKRKPNVRKIVERNRKVKLARRVRVKAKRADLKPRLRTAIQELKEGRNGIVSGVITVILVGILLSMITWDLESEPELDPIVSGFSEEPVEEPDPIPIEPPEEEQGEQMEQPVEEPVEEEPEPEPEPEEPEPEPEPETEVDEPMEPAEEQPAEMELPETESGETVSTENAMAESAVPVNNRSEAGKAALLEKYGGSVATESAVSKGLDWLASVQHPQGYWDFDIVGQATSPGTIDNPIGGTAYALLPFLAAGQTHKEGTYSKQVAAGLNYLTKIGIVSRAGYDLRGMVNKQSDDKEPNEAYYVHGAATLVLCEAYGMTKDRRLKKAADAALLFIINSQDPRGGGWRYNPGDPGSISVTAIQVMALMAGKKAGLKIPQNTLKGVHVFLDGLQVDREGRYGYRAESRGTTYTSARTAMALLCRMYLGWGRDDGDLRAGIALLDKAGPYDNLYSLYFATQVMKNWGGSEWERWNERFQPDLLAQQETSGPAAGSWKPRTGAIHARQGGRLLATSLAILTLEVYYRYEPLLPEQSQ